jgi:hypothetical protein
MALRTCRPLPGAIWNSYFDEGVFRGDDLGQAGLVCLDDAGQLQFSFNDVATMANLPPIYDCYALNVRALIAEGYQVKPEDLPALGPYQTRHIKCFGDYAFTVTSPEPFDGEPANLLPLVASPEQTATA